MSVNSRKTGARVSGINTTFTLSLLTLAVQALIAAGSARAAETTAAVTTSNSQQELVVTGSDTGAESQQKDYTVQTTRAGAKMLLAPRDVPQSVSVVTKQRMQDQNLQSIGEVLTSTTGISATYYDTERPSFYSRGFTIDNYSFDDIPTSLNDGWGFGDDGSDTAIYERIEVVRGATGLMSGSGNPGATVNMVRKHADSKTFQGNVSASYGSWDKQRYVLDVAAPLSASGAVRGRVIAGYQDQNSYLDRYKKDKKFLYGVVDADLTESLTASVGYDYQQSHTSNATFGGIPTWYSNGVRTRYARSTNPAADWAYYDASSRKVFASLTQNFANGWQVRVNGTHTESTFDMKALSANDFPDQTSGMGATGYGGWYKGKRNVDAVDAFASGPFELLGRQHQLLAGANYSRQRNHYDAAWGLLSASEMGNYNNWNGDVVEPAWSDWALSSDDTVRQKSAYSAARFSLADPLALIVGARYTQYSTNGTSAEMAKNNLTPYGGLVYDINENWSAYASYTSIFQPQKYRDRQGNYLSPVTGKNYETGLKSDWLNGSLTATLAVFRIEQDNVAVMDGSNYVNGSSEQAYNAAKGVVSRGVDFELNGAVTDNLKLTFGATRYVAHDASGDRVNAQLPQTSFKLFSSYTLPMLQQLTLGGGVNWQNRTYVDATGPSGSSERVFQKSYPLANLFARYQVTPQVTVQANINNLFDRTWYTYLGGYAVYGDPRSYSLNVSYAF